MGVPAGRSCRCRSGPRPTRGTPGRTAALGPRSRGRGTGRTQPDGDLTSHGRARTAPRCLPLRRACDAARKRARRPTRAAGPPRDGRPSRRTRRRARPTRGSRCGMHSQEPERVAVGMQSRVGVQGEQRVRRQAWTGSEHAQADRARVSGSHLPRGNAKPLRESPPRPTTLALRARSSHGRGSGSRGAEARDHGRRGADRSRNLQPRTRAPASRSRVRQGAW